jgi:hypothetical protein
MLFLSPENRERLFQDAFDQTMAKHPELDEIPPQVVAYMAKVFERIAELERMMGVGHA